MKLLRNALARIIAKLGRWKIVEQDGYILPVCFFHELKSHPEYMTIHYRGSQHNDIKYCLVTSFMRNQSGGAILVEGYWYSLTEYFLHLDFPLIREKPKPIMKAEIHPV